MPSFMVAAAGGTAAVIAGVLVKGSGSGLSSDLALTIASWVGNVAACSLIVVTLFTFIIPIVKHKTVGNRTVYGHVLAVLSCAAWGLFAVITWEDTRVSAIINAVCYLMQLVCVAVFIYFAAGWTRWTAVGLLMAVLVGCGVIAYMVLVKVMLRGEMDRSVIAAVASVISCVAYMAVGLDIAAVVTSKDVANMDPLVEVLLNMLCAAAWVYFAYMPSTVDNYVGVPNVIGVVLLAMQLGVYFMHCRAKPQEKEEEEEEEEGPAAPAAAEAEDETDNGSNASLDFGPDLALLFAIPSPHASSSSGSEIEVVIA